MGTPTCRGANPSCGLESRGGPAAKSSSWLVAVQVVSCKGPWQTTVPVERQSESEETRKGGVYE